MIWLAAGTIAAVLLAFFAFIAWQIRRRNLRRWLPAYWRERKRYQVPTADEEVHVVLCIADHYEPNAGGADVATGRQRVAKWLAEFPKQFGRFHDSDGRPPRYSFFFPIEEYEKEYLDALAQLCRAGFGEVEMHLHHDNDTAENLRVRLRAFKDTLVAHGLLSRHRKTEQVMYGFIHGNWALCNSHPDGRNCGVNNEIEIGRAHV